MLLKKVLPYGGLIVVIIVILEVNYGSSASKMASANCLAIGKGTLMR